MIDYRLHTFLTVCKYMNYTKAAEELFITQPAVSQHIHFLEKYYDTTLFIYKGKTLSLTPSGTLLLQKASTMENDSRMLKKSLQFASPSRITYKFGVTTTIGEFVIAKPLARFLHKHPEIHIQMTMSNTQDLLKGLRNGTYHFALIEGYFPENEFESQIYSQEEFIPVCASEHPFVKQPSRLQDLISEPLILRETGSGTRAILEKALDIKNIPLSSFAHITEINSMYTIVQLLLEDCGISFLYKAAVLPQLKSGKLRSIHLDDFQLKHDFSFLWQKGSIYREEYHQIFQELISNSH